MTIGPTKSSRARTEFHAKTVVNPIALVVVFALAVAGYSWLAMVYFNILFTVLGNLVLIAVAYYCYMYFETQGIEFKCDNAKCRQTISSNTPWVCGFCKQPNLNTNEFPMVHQCETCNRPPKAYRCHHCEDLVFFTTDKDRTGYAYAFVPPEKSEKSEKISESNDPKPAQPVAPDEDEIRQKKEKKAKEHELAIAEIDAKIEGTKRQASEPKVKSEKEAIKEKVREHVRHHMDKKDAFREIKAEAREKYQNDPDDLARALQAIKEAENEME